MPCFFRIKQFFKKIEDNKFEERIALLRAEYDEITNEINSDEANTVVSPKTGYFISSVDGFENVINKENIFEKTAFF